MTAPTIGMLCRLSSSAACSVCGTLMPIPVTATSGSGPVVIRSSWRTTGWYWFSPLPTLASTSRICGPAPARFATRWAM